MSAQEELSEEVRRLIDKYADEHDVPKDLLFRIHKIEREKIGMDRRHGLPADIRKSLRDHLNEDNI